MNNSTLSPAKADTDLSRFLPDDLGDLSDTQRAIPRIAKDKRLTALIEQALPQIPSTHDLFLGDARDLAEVGPETVHLVLTSPPTGRLKSTTRPMGSSVMSRTTNSSFANSIKSGVAALRHSCPVVG
jgi:hypothetical protein